MEPYYYERYHTKIKKKKKLCSKFSINQCFLFWLRNYNSNTTGEGGTYVNCKAFKAIT